MATRTLCQSASARGRRRRGARSRGSRPRGWLPPPRTKWTRRVPHPVLIGHAASLTRSVSALGARGLLGAGGSGAGGGGRDLGRVESEEGMRAACVRPDLRERDLVLGALLEQQAVGAGPRVSVARRVGTSISQPTLLASAV